MRVAAGIPSGALNPFVVLVEHNSSPGNLQSVVSTLDRTKGIAGAVAPPTWRKGSDALVEAFPSVDAAADSEKGVISNLQHHVLPSLEQSAGGGTQVTLGGTAPEDRDFVRAVYSKFPFAIAFV